MTKYEQLSFEDNLVKELNSVIDEAIKLLDDEEKSTASKITIHQDKISTEYVDEYDEEYEDEEDDDDEDDDDFDDDEEYEDEEYEDDEDFDEDEDFEEEYEYLDEEYIDPITRIQTSRSFLDIASSLYHTSSQKLENGTATDADYRNYQKAMNYLMNN